VNILNDRCSARTPSAIALGNFDGVHRGHRAVLGQVLGQINPTVVTFEPHPREYFTAKRGFLLTPGSEKLDLLAALGFCQVLVLPFTPELAQLPAPEFVKHYLVEVLGAVRVSIGPDFQFGYQRGGNARLLAELGASLGFELAIATETQWASGRVSSSAIREALTQGDLGTTRALLGRNYQLVGTVIHGEGRGRTLGFPTANLAVSERKFIPRSGVYLVRATWGHQSGWGLLNLGHRPTFEGKTQSLEVHLLDWQGDLYGQTLTIELFQYIRPEQKFNGIEELVQQIKQDVGTARELLDHAESF